MSFLLYDKDSALGRVNNLLGQVFSMATILLGIQLFVSAIPQAPLLNPIWFGLSMSAIVLSVALIQFLVWVDGDGTIGFRALTFSVLFSLTTWHLQLGDGSLVAGQHPWVWHGIGVAAIASVGAFSIGPASIMILGFPAIWFGIQISTIGSPEPFLHALQDSTYSLLTTAVIVAFVQVLRWEASKVDLANQQSRDAALEAARVDAVENERARVDALVHDAVLTTLLVSVNAISEAEQKSAAELATRAIEKLQSDGHAQLDENISVHSLFVALESAATGKDAQLQVDIEGASDESISGSVALALTEAALQALSNSLLHAGSGAKRELLLRAKRNRIKIVVKDDGRGFRASRIPKNRLGLRLSIIKRVEAVGGKVFIDSKPGQGTNIVIEWVKQ